MQMCSNPETQEIPIISPLTNEIISVRHGISKAEQEELPKLARKAFLNFSRTSLEERKEIIKRALKLLEDSRDVLAKDLTSYVGRPISHSAKEITTSVKRAEYLAKISEEVLRDTPGEAEPGFKRYIKKVAIGPVLILVTWNYPYLVMINSLVPALLVGNSVILIPSPRAPTAVEHISSIFTRAGLPEHVLQYLHCSSVLEIENLIRNPLISHICFTGSVATGMIVQKLAADRIVNVGLELGGKDPAYVRSDVDISWVAEEIVDGAIFNSGQSCCSVERVYVDETIHDEFIKAIQKVLENCIVGDPFRKETTVGPVISRKAKELIESHINDAIEKGALDVTPDNDSFKSFPTTGNFVKPTLLTNVTHDMIVMNDETFGPVIPVMKVKDDEEAIQLMNDSIFGLTASIWTSDTEKGTELAQYVKAGTVFVNRCDFPSPDLAWTGWKSSGKGVTLSRFGFDQFIRLKSFHVKEHPRRGID